MINRRDFQRGLVGAGVGAGAALASSAHTPSAIQAASTRSVSDPSFIDPRFDSRSASFENPTGGRGMGGRAGGGRKGSPARSVHPGEKIVLADLQGPATVRHIWMTFGKAETPEVARSLQLEIFYDGVPEPSVSVPAFDFFGLPHGRYAEFYSTLICTNTGRGLNSFIPLPFGRSLRIEFTNSSQVPVGLCYQIDYTLEPSFQEHTGYLHAAFRRQNPTTLRRDFVIVDGLKGPGRFLGCVVGIRPADSSHWYGEGEVKIYRDGDNEFPTTAERVPRIILARHGG